MATEITAPTPLSRTAPRFGVLGLVILAVTAVAVIAVVAWTQSGPVREVSRDSQPFGAGYPLHGGLAGPSRVGQVPSVGVSGSESAADLADHYGSDYPLHGGLAGPSRSVSAADLADHYGAGYPAHGGLAGPSRVDGD